MEEWREGAARRLGSEERKSLWAPLLVPLSRCHGSHSFMERTSILTVLTWIGRLEHPVSGLYTTKALSIFATALISLPTCTHYDAHNIHA